MHRALLGEEHLILHTGQHYDPLLSASFFEELGIPEPILNLNIGSGSHGSQTARILEGSERAIRELSPDWVLVYGDTNSTLAATLAAVKLHHRVVHLESGLRSRNRRMPEEHNRILTDHASDLCLAPSKIAVSNLEAEGLLSRSHFVGDVMLDVLFDRMRELDIPQIREERALKNNYVATLHRQENTDDPARLASVLSALDSLDHEVDLYTHPRLAASMARSNLEESSYPSINFFEAAKYSEIIAAISICKGVITDSGGLQKEAFALRAPCVTVRAETEWPETIELGWNTLCEPNAAAILSSFSTSKERNYIEHPYGDGRAAKRAVDVIRSCT
jgi:UDP-N-acetylglucosamine 2-epimerase (non-hydrolysing)